MLADGSLLLLGGERDHQAPLATAVIIAATNRNATIVTTHLIIPRAWHSATLLPDGTVLIFGGITTDKRPVSQAEIFDPKSLQFQIVATQFLPRAHHSAVLLTDGQVLIAGGLGVDGEPINTPELWDWRTSASTKVDAQLGTPRIDDASTLLADGTALLWGGKDQQGDTLDFAAVYDSELNRFLSTGISPLGEVDHNVPQVVASIPKDGSSDVATDAVLAVRFSKFINPRTLNIRTALLEGPDGVVAARVVAAGNGRLGFVTPTSRLRSGTKYTLTLEGIIDNQELVLVSKSISFTTASSSDKNSDSQTDGTSSDNAGSQNLAPLQAPPNVTAVAGQALQLDGRPLPNVTFKIDNRSTRSDRTGRFLLTNLPPGHHALVIDGRAANRGQHTYGVFEVGVDLIDKQALVLPYKVWMTELDTAHAVHVQFPTAQEVVITNPLLPGLEFHIPPNTVITDIDGKLAHEISITPIPLSQPPFPLPDVQVPIYFTIQPGGGYIQVQSAGPKGARLVYPNTFHYSPGTRIDFWNYDPDTLRGWFIYGQGTAEVNSIVPDPGVEIYQLTGAMVAGSGGGPGTGPLGDGGGGGFGGGSSGGDPVDLSTGLFVYSKADLALPDVIPISLTRIYRQMDSTSRAFGIGFTHPYDMFISGNLNDFSYVELVLPTGGRVRFDRISGNIWSNSTLQCITSPGAFYKALFTNQNGWTITLRDGTVMNFLQPGLSGPSKVQDVGLVSITDRNGNSLRVVRDSSNYVSRIVSPNGRWIQLTYDSGHRITQAQDSLGRIVQYSYNAQGQLLQVTDVNGGLWSYAWDPTHLDQLVSITDSRRIQFLQNQYDANGRVTVQTQADGSTFRFAYSTDSNNNVTQTQVTDPNGNVRQVSFLPPPLFASGFKSGAFTSTETVALGKPEQQSFTYVRDASTNFLLSVTDPLNRRTTFAYDSMGNRTAMTKLAGTAGAVTVSSAFDPTFNVATSFTDPLQHKTTFSYDNHGNLLSATDPAGHTSTYSHDGAGRLATATDPLGNTWNLTYAGADLATITDPMGNTSGLLIDGGGRLVSITDPLARTTRYQYNSLNLPITTTDASGGAVNLGYDSNGHLSGITDTRNAQSSTTYTYDAMDRLTTRTDPLGNSEAFRYDGNGNMTCFTDRRGKVTVLSYDGLNRPIFSEYGATSCSGGGYESTTSFSWDGGNRLASIVDSIAGTITPAFDDFDRVVSETTPQGRIDYQYDAAGRETTMTVAGQPTVTYTYDAGDRITQIAQGTSSVIFGYDAGGRRTSLTLPNGIVISYGYDNDSHLTSLAYSNGTTRLGDLTYTYGQDSSVMQIAGSYARTLLPQAVPLATYDTANRLMSWGGNSSYTYDANGSLISDGLNTYSWDARNQLSSISGGANASFGYDPFGRRIAKTVSGTTTQFLYDGLGIVQELSGSTPTANLLTGGTDEIFTRSDSSTVSYLTDALGSILALTDNSGSLTSQYNFEPFGNTSMTGSPSGNSSQFAGRENDGTGLYFYRARYYSPSMQRFISQDPIGFGGGDPNLYAYVFNSPVTLFDPTGLDAWTRVWGGVRVVGGGFETAAGVGLAVATGWTGVGAIAGGAVGLHGLDQVQAGLRQVFTGCGVDSFTSQGLQSAGLSQSSANLVDAGISVVGSLGTGAATQAIRAGGAGNIMYYEIGQKTLSADGFANYGQIADPVDRGMQIVADQGWGRALAPDPAGLSQFSKTIPQGLTPLAGGMAGALGGGGTAATAMTGRKGCGQ